jgi:hypothetical protein
MTIAVTRACREGKYDGAAGAINVALRRLLNLRSAVVCHHVQDGLPTGQCPLVPSMPRAGRSRFTDGVHTAAGKPQAPQDRSASYGAKQVRCHDELRLLKRKIQHVKTSDQQTIERYAQADNSSRQHADR